MDGDAVAAGLGRSKPAELVDGGWIFVAVAVVVEELVGGLCGEDDLAIAACSYCGGGADLEGVSEGDDDDGEELRGVRLEDARDVDRCAIGGLGDAAVRGLFVTEEVGPAEVGAWEDAGEIELAIGGKIFDEKVEARLAKGGVAEVEVAEG